MSQVVIEIKNLKKTYASQEHPALDNVSFNVSKNERIGVIGANGSGKTTLFRNILNLIRPDSGLIKIMENSDLEKAKINIGFVPEHQEGLENFTPAELLNYAGQMYGLASDQIQKRRNELLFWADLEEHQNELVSGFSKGMIQRLQLALAIIHQPAILLFDEPMSGLDPSGQKKIRTLLEDLDNFTLLYASHNLSEVESICQRVIILSRGTIVNDIIIEREEEQLFIIESEDNLDDVLKKYSTMEVIQKNKKKLLYVYECTSSYTIFFEFLAKCKEKQLHILRFRSTSLLEAMYDRYVKSGN
jgi:ABC-2 type transport system ATP-binding protein